MQSVVLSSTKTAVPDGGLSADYFYRMLSPQALRFSKPYNDEETITLETCLSSHPEVSDMNFLAVGGGELWALRLALAHTKSYTCIEPLADIFLNDSAKFLMEQSSNISYVRKQFDELSSHDIPADNNFFMFLFNIISYIKDPVAVIQKSTKPGDILFISTWTDTAQAQQCRTIYFDYLNSFGDQVIVDPHNTTGIYDLDSSPLDTLSVKSSQRIKGSITDILILYL